MKIEIFKHFRRDALAGIITGTMAVPLSIGICLMSDYPIMTGLYTVIFACIISFITSLIRPGNFVGTPGIAAGLAPALSLGIATFGFENMPFIIFMTSIFQMIVWKFRWERHILELVPHYLVEGLLAGVGLKIATKFIPFLYDTHHATSHIAIISQPLILLLSIGSLLGFVTLYNKFKSNMPAVPYLVIMGAGIALSFFIELPMVNLDIVPFKLILPLPSFHLFENTQTILTFIKMLGFTVMLGTIDVIEQVMSNVAIEKMDPLKRHCDSNNSLLSIWIANMGATFFGGMTNLDGLAKSTTNAVAGAITKLSNLFTAAVLLIVVMAPNILEHFPKYALGTIMIYSGWKMIANLNHVKKEGMYAMVMAIICGLLVFKLGIFEGLLIVLMLHILLQKVFKNAQTNEITEKISAFKKNYQTKSSSELIETYPVLTDWINAINSHNLTEVCKKYSEKAVFTPAFSTIVRHGIHNIEVYYRTLISKKELFIKLFDITSDSIENTIVYTGHFGIGWMENERQITNVMRFSMTISHEKIITHHTSLLPTGQCTISDWETSPIENLQFVF
jgi:MFS superfamily sulfate permease-like transporter